MNTEERDLFKNENSLAAHLLSPDGKHNGRECGGGMPTSYCACQAASHYQRPLIKYSTQLFLLIFLLFHGLFKKLTNYF